MEAPSSGLLEEFVHASPDALLIVDTEGVIQATSNAVTTVFGYEPGDLVGQEVEMLIPAVNRGSHAGYRKAYTSSPEIRRMGVGLRLMGLRKDGREFPVDVSLVPSRKDGELRVGAFVRDATVRRRSEDLLRFVNEMSHNALAGAPGHELFVLAAGKARLLVGAAMSWIAVPTKGGMITVAAADGPRAEDFLDVTLPLEESLSGRVMSGAGTLVVDDLSTHAWVIPPARGGGFGPGLYIPMQAEVGPLGVLAVARGQGESNFSEAEVDIAEIFASAAAVVLALCGARQELEDARLVAEHERIARDLHDTVIQRLFAVGMRLQAAERMAEGAIAERIGDTVESIDQVIREIRETIFDLSHPDHRDGTSLRREVRAVAVEAGEHLGFAPRVNFRGPVETAATEAVVAQLIPVLREALANIGRHARASSTDVLVSVSEGSLVLTVADDGVGVSDVPTAGHGTANMRERAEKLGGDLEIGGRMPSGTLVRWRVPLHA